MKNIGPVMLDIKGTTLNQEEKVLLKNPLVGGVILFARNIESTDQVLELNRSIRAINPDLVLAIDQEGGRVQRIKTEVTLLPALGEIGALYEKSPEKAKEVAEAHARLMASEMLSLGFDLSFSPVLDIEIGVSEVIGNRSFGSTPQNVTAVADAYLKGLRSVGMSAVGKHFPGHGSVAADSHHEIPIDERTMDAIEDWDLAPFKALADKLEGVMPAHVIYPKVCPSPAGFSKLWLQQVLRQQLQFNGVIFSDDLSMEGATVVGGFEERAKAALEAGCDMILVCNNPTAASQVIAYLENNSSATWLTETITKAQVRLKKLLEHDRPSWNEYQSSTERLQLQQLLSETIIDKEHRG